MLMVMDVKSSTSPSTFSTNDFVAASPGDSSSLPARGSRIHAIKLRLIQQGLQIDESVTYPAPAVVAPKKRAASTTTTTTTTTTTSNSTPTTTTAVVSQAQTVPRKNIRRRYRGYFENTCTPISLASLWKSDSLLKRILFRVEDVNDLKNCSRVCQAWRRMAHKHSKWSTSCKATFNSKMRHNMEQLEKFLELCYLRNIPNLELLYLDNGIVDRFLRPQEGCDLYVKHVDSIVFIACTFSENVFRKVLENFSTATSLEFHGCNTLSEAVLWSSLPPNLLRLVMVDCIRLSNECMAAILETGTHLTQLQLQSYHLSDKMASYFELNPCSTLRQLSLLHCLQMNHLGLSTLVQTLPNLTHLELSGCSQVCDDTLDVISCALKNLQTFECAWCPSVSDTGLECLATSTHSLRRLVLDRCSGITDVGIEYLTNLPQLNSLSLRWCPGVNDIVLLHCLKIKHLQELCITGCHRVTRSGVESLVQHDSLRHLELRNNTLSALSDVITFFTINIPLCSIYV